MNVYRYEGPDERYPLAVPLLDVILLIVAFYAIVSAAQAIPGDMNLSVTDRSEFVAGKTIRLDPSGQLYYNDTWYTSPELIDVLNTDHKHGADQPVHLLVDEETSFSTIKTILKSMKSSGLNPRLSVILAGEAR